MSGVNVVGVGEQVIIGYTKGISFPVIGLAILIIMLTILCITMAICMFGTSVEGGALLFIGLVALLIVILCFAMIDAYNNKPIYGPSSIVTIDNSVNFQEFMNKYEILEQNGQLYTVIEK